MAALKGEWAMFEVPALECAGGALTRITLSNSRLFALEDRFSLFGKGLRSLGVIFGCGDEGERECMPLLPLVEGHIETPANAFLQQANG